MIASSLRSPSFWLGCLLGVVLYRLLPTWLALFVAALALVVHLIPERRRCPSSASPEHVCTGYRVGVLRGPRDCEGRPL